MQIADPLENPSKRDFLGLGLGFPLLLIAPSFSISAQEEFTLEKLKARTKIGSPILKIPAGLSSVDFLKLRIEWKNSRKLTPTQVNALNAAFSKANKIIIPGNPNNKEHWHILVDPNCPYCAQNYWNFDILANKPTVTYYFRPYSGRNAIYLSAAISQHPSPVEALEMAFVAGINNKRLHYSTFEKNRELLKDSFNKVEADSKLFSNALKEISSSVPFHAVLGSHNLYQVGVLSPLLIELFTTVGDLEKYQEYLLKT